MTRRRPDHSIQYSAGAITLAAALAGRVAVAQTAPSTSTATPDTREGLLVGGITLIAVGATSAVVAVANAMTSQATGSMDPRWLGYHPEITDGEAICRLSQTDSTPQGLYVRGLCASNEFALSAMWVGATVGLAAGLVGAGMLIGRAFVPASDSHHATTARVFIVPSIAPGYQGASVAIRF